MSTENLAEKLKAYDSRALVEQLQKIDQGIKEAEARFKETFAPAKATAEAIRGELLRRLSEQEQTSIKFDNLATIVRAPKTTYSIQDPGAFTEYVLQSGDLSMFGATLIVGGVNKYKEENDDQLPPGIASSTAYVLALRAAK